LQLSADPKGPVEATVVESEVEPGLGKTAVVLVRRGTLKKGDFLVCGSAYAKVKMLLSTGAVLEDERGHFSSTCNLLLSGDQPKNALVTPPKKTLGSKRQSATIFSYNFFNQFYIEFYNFQTSPNHSANACSCFP
jgi:hypothetical protein